ncbi:PilW family protein [Clostridium oryzae]|uniref:Prepilin-type N-terminal cleavage/methylation domain-containing protein n=1 Tax=Clostridium oryzae TaxID=1450648 RepID=A0A1V4INN5_9CLOT|nr:prepilin-type N-terminal cleavage/methylation domain-containing protein [Clostridium oryzae]OPJ61513.1 hypothetical protein CLORY_21950 [Clostridium oryzae]
MKYNKTLKGITLIELVIALALSAIISAIMFSFYMPHQKALAETEKRSQLQMDAQNLMQYFSKSALEASKITTLNGISGEAELNSYTGNHTVSNIIFSVNDINGTSQYTYKYVLDGRSLKYTDSKVTDKVIANDINSIDIKPLNGQTVGKCSGISIIVELISDDNRITYKVMDNLYFRNET